MSTGPGPGPEAESEADEIDLALAAVRDDGEWHLEELPDAALDSVDDLARTLRRLAHDDAALALVSVEEDFFLLLRLRDSGYAVLLSDVGAATDWALAHSAVEHLALPVEDDETAPAGDLGLLADLGIPAADLALILDEEDLYPDEQLSDIATRLGFGEAFDELAGLTTA